MTRVPMLLAGIGIAAIGISAAPVHAQSFITGSQLAHACGSHTPADENACNGYIAGVLDDVASNPEAKAALCPPSSVKLSALRMALGKFAEQKPEETKGGGISLVKAMLKANYPCPSK